MTRDNWFNSFPYNDRITLWRLSLGKWLQKNCKPFTANQLGLFISNTFLLCVPLIQYVYGLYAVLPHMLEPCSFGFFVVAAVATWCLIATVSNAFLTRTRSPLILRPRSRIETEPEPESESKEEETKVDADDWHECPKCRIIAPPRAWHCDICETCVLRRDHHCGFTGSCIGWGNVANFMGFMFYIAMGTLLYSTFAVYYILVIKKTNIWHFLLRLWVIVYTFWFDLDVLQFVTSISIVSLGSSAVLFLFYLSISLNGQTSADFSRKIKRSDSTSLKNLREMLGPNPFWKIIWPFHEPPKRLDVHITAADDVYMQKYWEAPESCRLSYLRDFVETNPILTGEAEDKTELLCEKEAND